MKKVKILCIAIILSANSLAQTGGTFDLSHSVVAGGGSNSTGGAFRADGTAGQAVAGTSSSGATYDMQGGFWSFNQLTPTAANVSISGRVTTVNGQGIRNARLTLTAPDGSVRTAITGSFGYYRFDEIEVGHTYILQIIGRKHTFTEPTRVISLQDEVMDIDFIAIAN